MEDSEKFIVKVNGEKINFPARAETWVDICFKKTPLPTNLLKQGKNIIELEGEFDEETDLESIYLFGDFGVKLEGKKKTITSLPKKLKAGSITNQGLPFYSGGVRYKIPIGETPGEKIFISVAENEGALIKVFAGEKLIGYAPWEPYEIDITDVVKAGVKEIDVEVVLTRRNTFGPLHQIPLIAHAYGPDNFITEGVRFTDEYMLYPAGILASVKLIGKNEKK